jgi:hypothetical protein
MLAVKNSNSAPENVTQCRLYEFGLPEEHAGLRVDDQFEL